MSFKDAIQNDLGVFFNLGEFAEVHNVDGQQISVVIDTDDTNQRARQPIDLYNAANGVYTAQVTVHLKASDMPSRPPIGQHMRLDGELYLVAKCSESAGVLTLVLEANQA